MKMLLREIPLAYKTHLKCMATQREYESTTVFRRHSSHSKQKRHSSLALNECRTKNCPK